MESSDFRHVPAGILTYEMLFKDRMSSTLSDTV